MNRERGLKWICSESVRDLLKVPRFKRSGLFKSLRNSKHNPVRQLEIPHTSRYYYVILHVRTNGRAVVLVAAHASLITGRCVKRGSGTGFSLFSILCVTEPLMQTFPSRCTNSTVGAGGCQWTERNLQL